MDGYKAKRGEKRKSSPLISPAIYEEGTTRANRNVIAWAGWAAVDIDNYEGDWKDYIEKIKNYEFICYSTASSTKDHPKFRIVFPLTKDVPAEKIKHFWYALNLEIGDVGDQQTKDLSRMYYVPAQYPNAYNFIFVNEGEHMNPSKVMANHEYHEKSANAFFDMLPKEMQREMIQKRKNELTNTSYTWTSYKDCPFVNQKMVLEYQAITETGWYAKLYAIMVSIACKAVKMKYPITVGEIVNLCRELDSDTGSWYATRPLDVEAKRALEYAFTSN